MTNQLQIFSNDAFGKIRGILIDGVPYFVGKDVAKALGYKDHKNALKDHVRDKHKLGWQITTSGQRRQVTLISEPGLYALVMKSKLPSAEKFQDWIFEDVIPSIRKTGTYTLDKDYQHWLETRQHGIISRKQETSAIKQLIDWARSQGCTWKDYEFYATITVWCNEGAGLPRRNGRDNATVHQLNIIDLLEGTMIRNVIVDGIADGIHWLQIWAIIQQKIRDFLNLLGDKNSLIGESTEVAALN